MRRFPLLLLALNLAACSSLQYVDIQALQQSQSQEVQIGDRVQVVTRDNAKIEFVVTDMDELGLGGEFGFVPYANMSRLRVYRPGGDEATQWLWVALGVAAAVALISAADSVKVCSPGPCPDGSSR
jgi:hypothetical protein